MISKLEAKEIKKLKGAKSVPEGLAALKLYPFIPRAEGVAPTSSASEQIENVLNG